MKIGIASTALLVLVAGLASPAAAGEYLHLDFPAKDSVKAGYGGIPSEAPPTGTAINQELSKYYGVPVATRDMEIKWVTVQEYTNGDFENVVMTNKPVIVKAMSPTKYFYIGGFWFTRDEMMNLPMESLMYGQSPYAITDTE